VAEEELQEELSDNTRRRVFLETMKVSSNFSVEEDPVKRMNQLAALSVLAVASNMEDNEAKRLVNVAKNLVV
jgi:hypothetical protein